ncbi:UNVERIFIED_CONTAM: Protein-tyrosine-phosphatase PTP1 [Sesamum calycinum]|uniref:Protein-tyrosine-phosphatase PTP1 n=1 Tax=Sesamum calycinum TaxID=2727403 RepID=A0AAW2JPD9_9LAMI
MMRASDTINRCTVALDSLNYSKNRYTDVLPFDDNRVILKRCTDYRSSARGVSRFIATQGQLSHTSEDFWEMIIQYHCPVIVMLTRLVDNYRANRMRASDMINRCTVALDSLNYSKNRYTDVLPFDDNRVILKRCTDYRSSARGTSESVSRFIATQGQLSHTSEDFWEMIIQYHCPVIVMLTRLVDNYRTSESVSRFIATQGQLSHTSEDFWEMIIQYHCPVIVMLTRLVDNYRANRLRASDMINRCTVTLDSLNYSKNRYTDVLPFDDNRVILKGCTDYRSSARGTSESVSRFIAAQGQLSHTSEDFWEMIIQYHCPVIVMLTRLVDNHRANRMRASDMINRCTVALDSLNYSKKLDDNRVILKRCTDYRSSARGTSESVSRFIATQGPLSHTSEDFWEMIIQYHCPVIVMLTRLVDNYHEQCLFCYDATIDELDPYFADYM